MDGATKAQQARHITLPAIKPVFVMMLILDCGKIFNSDFGLFFQVTGQLPASLYTTASTFDTYIYMAIQSTAPIGQTAAASFFQAICSCGTILLANWVVSKIDNENRIIWKEVCHVAKQDKSGQSLNQIKTSTNIVFNIVFLILAVMCVIPLLFVFSISITDEEAIRQNGYQLIPQALSGAAYEFLWNERLTILRAAFMSVLVTVVGTVISIALNTSMGYVVSRRNFKLKKLYTWLIFIPMVFNGGMLASYVVVSNILGLNNSIWALILPLACSAFSVTICRTFFRTTVPDSIIESAKIDGAGQFRIWSQIVLPISKPVMATIGMFAAFGYWNDWFQASLYIQDTKLQTLQSLLNQMQKNIEYIANNPYGGLSMQEYKLSMPTESVRMAIAIVIIVPIACTYPFFQKYFISGLTIGSVKE